MSQARSAAAPALTVRLVAVLVVSLLLLMGCSRPGDLGRPHQTSALHDASPDRDPVYTAAIANGGAPLTDDERQLRDLAEGIFSAAATLNPPGRFGGAKVEHLPGAPPALQRETYAAYLVSGPFRSVTARYSRLIDDTRSDIARLEAFYPIARRVADMDAKRERSLAHVRELTEAQLVSARRRMRENMMLMAEVQRTLAERAGVYRYTLERLVVAVPSPMAVDAERTRTDFEQRLGAIRVVGTGPPPAIASR
jgi:hypothetical protein